MREKTAALMERVKTLAPAYQEWVQSVAGLMSIAELEYFLDLEQDYRRDAFMEAFWQPRDPDPTTPGNELRMRWEEYKRDSGRAAVRRSALRRLPDQRSARTLHAARRPPGLDLLLAHRRARDLVLRRQRDHRPSTSSSSSRSAAPTTPVRDLPAGRHPARDAALGRIADHRRAAALRRGVPELRALRDPERDRLRGPDRSRAVGSGAVARVARHLPRLEHRSSRRREDLRGEGRDQVPRAQPEPHRDAGAAVGAHSRPRPAAASTASSTTTSSSPAR